MTQDTQRPGARIGTIALGAAVFGVAATLRFVHLDFGLRHQPDYDERIFVENALGMIARDDWDHRFYEYPGLLIWILRIVLTATGARGADAYLVARSLIAFISAITVLLVFVVVSSWVSRRSALVVALMLALSPIDIEIAHMLHPDSVIAALLFAALALAAPRNGEGSPWLAWVAATVATAIKFSAAIVFAPLLLAALAARTTLPRIAARSLLALVLFAVLSPYTLLGGTDSVAGMRVQLAYHYEATPTSDFASRLGGLLTDTLPRALSLPGLALAAWGAAMSLRARSRWALCWILFPTLWIVIFSTTGARFGRFMVPTLGALCLLAAVGLEDLFVRTRLVTLATSVLALALPALDTSHYLSALHAPLTLDQALDRIGAAPEIESVGSTIPELGALDIGGGEIVPLRGFRGDAFVASQFDALVLTGAVSTPSGFVLVARFSPKSIHNGPEVAVFRALTPRRFSTLDLRDARVRSSAPQRDSQLSDGQVSTRWRADASPAFIEVAWPSAVVPVRLEIAFGATPPDREFRLKVSDDSGVIETHSLRPPLERQRQGARGLSQLLAWLGRPPTRTLRIDLAGPVPLQIGELRVFADAAPAGLR